MHIVIININYFYFQAPSRPGFGPVEMSVVLSNLMKRIGHNQYYIQGGDFGHMLGSILATLMPEQVLGFHTNMPVLMFHPLANIYMMLGEFCMRWWCLSSLVRPIAIVTTGCDELDKLDTDSLEFLFINLSISF